MPLYIDTEFTTFQGELISLGIANTDGNHWYNVLPIPSNVNPWITEHVIPFLNATPISQIEFRKSLWTYLRSYNGSTIYADWGEDISHFCSYLCDNNGMSPKYEFDIKLINSGKLFPTVPHNALSDAIALMEWHISSKKEGVK